MPTPLQTSTFFSSLHSSALFNPVSSLRSIVRNLLATGPPGLAPAFTQAAQSRLRQTAPRASTATYPLFRKQSRDGPSEPLPQLHETLTRARSLYGAGLGFASLGVLASIVRATVGLRWEEDGDMADILAVIDADIGQAIQASIVVPSHTTAGLIKLVSQSAKEEIESGRVHDFTTAREVRNDLRSAVNATSADVKEWGGEFPFERAAASLEYWKF